MFFTASAQIRLNTLGFFPNQPKRASIAAACTNFSVVRLDNSVAFKGPVGPALSNPDTSETICVADFSQCREVGTFELEVPGVGRSAPFQISSNVYGNAFYLVTRGFYLWRCGTAVAYTNNGKIFAHDACHTNDAWLDFVTGEHVMTNSTKGWHDAGDYNKYVVNAGVTLGVLFRAWEDFGGSIKKVRLDLPEAGGVLPEFLSEMKWEVDWLLTMQAPDGSVYHKVSTERFGPFVAPEKEQTPRYFSPWSSAATADFVAVMAMAARDFRPYEPAYADECLHAAEKSYAFLLAHPEDHQADLSHFTTGPYQIRDSDVRIWAAAELWETTGQSNYLHDFEKRISQVDRPVDLRWDYGNVKNLGTITYLFSKRDGRNASTVEMLRTK
ncbi:MAG TPA: glycoside hydrolase family 9 protein, partial [Verrucomicrobiae bacterium]|nr:glycoside hydrolase family 9 protein [Verrucomicrobiae bacterium]